MIPLNVSASCLVACKPPPPLSNTTKFSHTLSHSPQHFVSCPLSNTTWVPPLTPSPTLRISRPSHSQTLFMLISFSPQVEMIITRAAKCCWFRMKCSLYNTLCVYECYLCVCLRAKVCLCRSVLLVCVCVCVQVLKSTASSLYTNL